jgi:chromosome segregation ATPase
MEAADVLYGVSMPPGGSSRVVSQRISDLQFEDSPA